MITHQGVTSFLKVDYAETVPLSEEKKAALEVEKAKERKKVKGLKAGLTHEEKQKQANEEYKTMLKAVEAEMEQNRKIALEKQVPKMREKTYTSPYLKPQPYLKHYYEDAHRKDVILRRMYLYELALLKQLVAEEKRIKMKIVYDTFGLSGYGFALYRQRGCKDELISSRSKTVHTYGLSHGDMLYLIPLNGAMLWTSESNPKPSTSGTPNNTPSGESIDSPEYSQTSVRQSMNLQEVEVELLLWKSDGKVQRKRDEKLCRHGLNACCVHCSPLEPFDEAYLKEQNIKHLSFHSYLRKLTAGVDRGKFVSLEDISCRIKTGFKDHLPWPKGICSKCQPNAITLNRQICRHVDNVMFENAHLVERFLNYWHSTGHQRIGFLYGKYEIHTDVPLGIRARVTAIYEPPQVGKEVDEWLEELHASRFMKLGVGDEDAAGSRYGSIEADFDNWNNQLWARIDKFLRLHTVCQCDETEQEKALSQFGSSSFDSGSSCSSDEEITSGHDGSVILDLEELGSFSAPLLAAKGKILEEDTGSLKEMVTPMLMKESLTKQGYRSIGSHSGVKFGRWTKKHLEDMANEGNPIACFPGITNLPEIRKLIHTCAEFKLTKKLKDRPKHWRTEKREKIS